MKGRSFIKAIGKLHRGEKGITGLETAIILIAFVTVAAVLAYSVLSAGIFSSEKGQEAVYSGLQAAQSSMQVAGDVYCTNNPKIKTLIINFQLKSILASETVDLGKCTVNYQDAAGVVTKLTTLTDPAVTGFSGILQPNDVQLITVDVSSRGLAEYALFSIEIIPATGAAINIEKDLPGEISANMNLR